MGKLQKAMRLLKEMRKKKERVQAEAVKQRIDDLFIKFYEFEPDIRIPIPNQFADAQINRRFGGMDKVDFEKNEHLAGLLFILENQQTDKLMHMGSAEFEEAVNKTMQTIPLPLREKYQLALIETFTAVKKNSIRQQQDILQQALAIITGEEANA